MPQEFWKLQWELIVTFIPRSKLWLFCNWSKIFHISETWRIDQKYFTYLKLGEFDQKYITYLKLGELITNISHIWNLENWSEIFCIYLKVGELENVVGLVVNMVDWTLLCVADQKAAFYTLLYFTGHSSSQFQCFWNKSLCIIKFWMLIDFSFPTGKVWRKIFTLQNGLRAYIGYPSFRPFPGLTKEKPI